MSRAPKLTIVSLIILLSAVAPVPAATVYHTSIQTSYNQFWAYDTDTDAWTRLNDFQTGSTLAVDSSGNVFAYSGNRNAIMQYDRANDTWNHYLNAPTITGYADYGLVNLEVTNSGRFLLTGYGTTNLYYTDGGAWSTVALGFQGNATGDYDPTTGQYALTPFAGTSPKLIDTETFTVTNFSIAGSGGEWRRDSVILDGHYYVQVSNYPVDVWDLSDPSAAPGTAGSVPSGMIWSALAADRENGYIYAAALATNGFYRYDGDSWIALANVGASLIHHSTIAFVPDALTVPEPSSLALAGLGAFGTALVALRRRRRK